MAKAKAKIVEEKTAVVWAFKQLKELDNETGLIYCTPTVADKLLKANKVQDPKVGALSLKAIEYVTSK